MLHIPSLYIHELEGKGLAVFTAEALEPESLIETCPVIILSKKDLQKIHETRLHDYYFLWGPDLQSAAIALGYGSLYNHAENPNAYFQMDYENERIDIISKTAIEAGEEICINYVEENNRGVKLWFEVKA